MLLTYYLTPWQRKTEADGLTYCLNRSRSTWQFSGATPERVTAKMLDVWRDRFQYRLDGVSAMNATGIGDINDDAEIGAMYPAGFGGIPAAGHRRFAADVPLSYEWRYYMHAIWDFDGIHPGDARTMTRLADALAAAEGAVLAKIRTALAGYEGSERSVSP